MGGLRRTRRCRALPADVELLFLTFDLLVLPFLPLIAVPGLPFVPTLALWILLARRWTQLTWPRRIVAAVAAATWVAYAIYESFMYVWMQSVVAPIRLDLLLIVPPLYLSAGIVIVIAWTATWRPPDEEGRHSRRRRTSRDGLP